MRSTIIKICLALIICVSIIAAQAVVEIPRFPDYGYMLDSKQYQGRRFKLSQDYPTSLPKIDPALQNILSIDFKKDWKQYADAVSDYIFAGNINTTNQDYENTFFFEDNKIRPWYHPPWLHWGNDATEGFHGLSRDATAVPFLLSKDQKTAARIYSVSFYSPRAGYVINKVWPRSQSGPDLSYFKEGNLFPDGSIMVALAFTTAKINEVPYLKNPIDWNAYVRCQDIPGCNTNDPNLRKRTKVHFIQMDVMIADSRAKETGGWVFTAFLYNGNLKHKNKWLNIIPIGISWGNDPQVKLSSINPNPTTTIINKKLTSTRINTSKDLPPMHLGWGGRFNGSFNGSANAPALSCGSCHTASQFPTLSAVSPRVNVPPIPVPKVGSLASEEWMWWFQDIKPGKTLNKGTVSFDSDMLLIKGIYGYLASESQQENGKFSVLERSKLFNNLSE